MQRSDDEIRAKLEAAGPALREHIARREAEEKAEAARVAALPLWRRLTEFLWATWLFVNMITFGGFLWACGLPTALWTAGIGLALYLAQRDWKRLPSALRDLDERDTLTSGNLPHGTEDAERARLVATLTTRANGYRRTVNYKVAAALGNRSSASSEGKPPVDQGTTDGLGPG